MAKAYERAKMTEKEFFFIHCRDANDFTKIKEIIPDVVTLLVWREEIEPSNEQDAATILYDYDYMIRLEELGTNEYESQIDDLIKMF